MNKLGLIVLTIVMATSCSTVTRGTKQGVKFQSEPPGAKVVASRITGDQTQYECTTPCELQLSRKRDFNVTFEKEGYKPATARLASKLGAKGAAAAVLGNFVAGGGIGFIVDAGTGANMQLKPDPMVAKLVPVDSDEKSVVYNERVIGGGVKNKN